MEQKETDAAQEQRCRGSLRRLRLQSGMAVLYVAMGAMAALAALDAALSLWGAGAHALIGDAFEAFKLIAVTVLGYIFGANQTKPDE